MRLLGITVLACIIAAQASPNLDIVLGGIRGRVGGYVGSDLEWDLGHRHSSAERFRKRGRGGGYSHSGYEQNGRDRGRDYESERRDFKAVVQGHESREHDRSYERGYSNRGHQSEGYGSLGYDRRYK